MYNERNSEFSIRDIVLQLLFVVLFVFILVWLFPTKGDISKLANKSNNSTESLDPILVRIFNDNLMLMKEAGKEYFTLERLPEKVGDKVSITLGQMLDKKLLLPFVDRKGRQCDLTKSFVEVTKTSETEYLMKVNLSCTDTEDYILIPMGCYNFCETAICEKEEVKPITNPGGNKDTTPTPTPNKPQEPKDPKKPQEPKDPKKPQEPKDPKKPQEPKDPKEPQEPKDPKKPQEPKDPKEPQKPKDPKEEKPEYLYEYTKTLDPYFTDWGRWSSWSEDYVRKTPVVDVETYTSKTTVKLDTGKIRVIETQVPYTDIEKVIETSQIEKQCAKWEKVVVPTGQVKYLVTDDWKKVGTVQKATPPKDTDTVRYFRIADSAGDSQNCDGDCSTMYATYEVWERVVETVEVKQTKEVCSAYKIKYTPIYVDKYVTKYKTFTKSIPIYEEIPAVITYYRYREREYIKGETITKWSKYYDKELLDNGFTYTGRRKLIQN